MYDGPNTTAIAIGSGSTAVIGGGTLAKTGAPVALWLIVALVLLAIGLLLVRASHLRRTAEVPET
mgnify:CR=1 FL=1